MMQMIKISIIAALLGSAQVAANAYEDPVIFAWEGSAAGTDLWILAAAPSTSVSDEVTVKFLDLDAKFSTSSALVAYGTDTSASGPDKWTSTRGSVANGGLADTAYTQYPFETFKDSAIATNNPEASSKILFHVSNVNFVREFTDDASNNVDGTKFYSSATANNKCSLETVSQRTATTDKYQLDFKVKCSAAVAANAKFVISILRKPLGAAALGLEDNWASMCESDSVIETCATMGSGMAVDFTASDIFYTFTFTAAKAVSANTSHYLTIVGTNTQTTVPSTAIIFTTATTSGDALEQYSAGTCTTAACAPATSSSSRIVSFAAVPVLPLLIAAMSQ